MKLASIENAKENLNKAINAYKEALKFTFQEKNIVRYFMLQKSIGDAYYELSFKENRKENLSKALNFYERFLRIEKEIDGYMYLQTMFREIKNKVQALKSYGEKEK